jgi:subtilase family serine protease
VITRPAQNYIGVNVSIADSPKYPKQMFAGQFVSPDVLRHRYQIDSSARGQSALNSQSVAEFLGQYTSMEDMNKFVEIFDVIQTDIKVVGFNNQSLPGGEATLDIEYIIGVAPNVTTTFWSLGNQLQGRRRRLRLTAVCCEYGCELWCEV